ncbi:heat shock protein [Gonapodya prolifera JEL478]|uniref:Heat shock protein n=1 Tax=Gonapodya prolifera (strain JEL478) TaxID=1344416 RepID=A0A139A434_GONPJ|nr:heat shock protein [Gonapodya prolifera JEL478]|eukprot:KXS11474.1 heat shock protein [Gonapodya prolifera JEL478]
MRRQFLLLALFAAAFAIAATPLVSAESDAVPEHHFEGIPDEKLAQIHKTAETFQFQTEVTKVLNILINSLYKSKEIFLRELISNGADALDKIRFISLTDKEALSSNDYLNITIRADKEAKTLTIRDSGIGMTKNDLIRNLGTIAKSGTSDFLHALENNTADMNLIGQFGVGFYSIYLVADTVSVVSKNNADKQHIWESTAENSFTVVEDPRGNTLGRGTEITLYLKDNAMEFLEDEKLKTLVHKYSQFINFPIYLWTTKIVTEQVPDSDATPIEPKEKTETSEDDLEVEDVIEEEAPKLKTIAKEVGDYEVMNENKPLWVRKRKEITEQEYKDFYTAFTKDKEAPAAWIHFKAEGEHEFRSLLYAPAKGGNLNSIDHVWNIKLYVRRVFITDELPGFLPRWLTFLKGLVDSDDFPLNVSRETLQNSDILKFIKGKIISKALEMFKTLSYDEEKYKPFLKEYGTHLKVGIIEDRSHAKKLMKLVRFASTAHNFTSLDSYVNRMKSKQAQIYVMTGESIDEMKISPFVEKVVARGYEVLLAEDPIDEYLFQNIFEYEGKPFQNVAKVGLKFGDESEDEAKQLKDAEEKYKPLTEFLQATLSEFVEKVVISNRLTKSPAAIVASSWGWTAHTEKLMTSQAFANKDDQMAKIYRAQKKNLEINDRHPVIEGLLKKIEAGNPDPDTIDVARTVYETALLRSGYPLPDMEKFSSRIDRIVRAFLGVDEAEEAKVEITPAKPKSDEEKKDEKEKTLATDEDSDVSDIFGEVPEDIVPPIEESSDEEAPAREQPHHDHDEL